MRAQYLCWSGPMRGLHSVPGWRCLCFPRGLLPSLAELCQWEELSCLTQTRTSPWQSEAADWAQWNTWRTKQLLTLTRSAHWASALSLRSCSRHPKPLLLGAFLGVPFRHKNVSMDGNHRCIHQGLWVPWAVSLWAVISPGPHGSVTDVAAGPDERRPGLLHPLPDLPPLLLGLQADEVHAAELAPVPRPRPVPGHGRQVGRLVSSQHAGLLLGAEQLGLAGVDVAVLADPPVGLPGRVEHSSGHRFTRWYRRAGIGRIYW